MLRIWVTFTTIVNSVLAAAGLGVAGYAVTAKPSFILFYYAVAFICVAGGVVGFVNLWFLHEALRRSDEKHRPAREERERRRAHRAAKRAEREAARAEREAAREAEKEAAARAAQEQQAAALAAPPVLDEDADEAEAVPQAPEGEEDSGEVTVL